MTISAWLAENWGTLIVATLLAAAVVAILINMIRKRQNQGTSSCSGCCSGCVHGSSSSCDIER